MRKSLAVLTLVAVLPISALSFGQDEDRKTPEVKGKEDKDKPADPKPKPKPKPLETFEEEMPNKKMLTLTRSLPAAYMGEYHQKGGKWEWKFFLSPKATQSWFHEQKSKSKDTCKPKLTFKTWGVFVKDIDKKKIYTFAKKFLHFGEKITDPKAMVILYKSQEGDKWYETHLYHRPPTQDPKTPYEKWVPEIKLAVKVKAAK